MSSIILSNAKFGNEAEELEVQAEELRHLKRDIAQIGAGSKELLDLMGIHDRLKDFTLLYLKQDGSFGDVVSRMDNISECVDRLSEISIEEKDFAAFAFQISNSTDIDVKEMAEGARRSRELIDRKKTQLFLWASALDELIPPSSSYYCIEIREIISSLSARRPGPRWVSNDTPRP